MSIMASYTASAMLLMAGAAIAQDAPPPPPQPAPGEVARPIVGGRHNQPNAGELQVLQGQEQERTLPPPPPLDPITREFLEGGPLSRPGSHK
jgi:hypothetical protein